MELESAIGRRVKISLEDGAKIDGFVHSFRANTGKISLEKVECLENGRKKKLVGLQHYFAEEITSIIVTEDVSKHRKKTKTTESGGHGRGGMLKSKCESSHLNRLQFLDPSSLVLKNKKQDDTLTSSGNETASSDSDIDNLPQSDEYTIIPKLCNTFYEAIAYIKKHQVIAVATEGISIGRFGRLCWLQIAVPGHVFLFDVLQIGRACFDEGVGGILENEDILKVLHDCRMVSDMLHHQYDINMINVFDTQVANVFVYRLKNHNDWPRHVDGLASSLVHHLDLTQEEVNWAVIRENRREEDEEVWKVRPPQRHLVEAAVKNVKHLLELRQVLMEKMMEEFVAGVNIYLMHVRDASDNDAKRYQTTRYLLPVAFQDIRAFMSSYRGRNPHFNVKEVHKDLNGFRENCSGIIQPDVYFSKDSLWHGGTKKTGPQSASSMVNSKSPSQETASAVKQVFTESQEKIPLLTQINTNTSPQMDSHSVQREETVIPTQRQSHSLPLNDDNLPEQSHETVIPSRKNIHSSAQSELVAKAVAAMNAKKLEIEEEISHIDVCEQNSKPQINHLGSFGEAPNVRQGANAELKGGSLMRALVHEQDATGNEYVADIENFSILPAGKMTREKKMKKTKPNNDTTDKSQSQFSPRYQSYSQDGNFPSSKDSQNREPPISRYSNDELRPAIPGGDIATTSPPNGARLTEQELFMLERLQYNTSARMHEHDIYGSRAAKASSDNDIPLQRSQTQGTNNYRLIDQLTGKSASLSYASDSGTTVSHMLHDDHIGRFKKSSPERNRSNSTVPSEPSPKLQCLLQKLKQ